MLEEENIALSHSSEKSYFGMKTIEINNPINEKRELKNKKCIMQQPCSTYYALSVVRPYIQNVPSCGTPLYQSGMAKPKWNQLMTFVPPRKNFLNHLNQKTKTKISSKLKKQMCWKDC
jgi:hypothetical protein